MERRAAARTATALKLQSNEFVRKKDLTVRGLAWYLDT